MSTNGEHTLQFIESSAVSSDVKLSKYSSWVVEIFQIARQVSLHFSLDTPVTH